MAKINVKSIMDGINAVQGKQKESMGLNLGLSVNPLEMKPMSIDLGDMGDIGISSLPKLKEIEKVAQFIQDASKLSNNKQTEIVAVLTKIAAALSVNEKKEKLDLTPIVKAIEGKKKVAKKPNYVATFNRDHLGFVTSVDFNVK